MLRRLTKNHTGQNLYFFSCSAQSKQILPEVFEVHGDNSILMHATEPISKRFSLVKVKAGEDFNRKNTLSILRIEI